MGWRRQEGGPQANLKDLRTRRAAARLKFRLEQSPSPNKIGKEPGKESPGKAGLIRPLSSHTHCPLSLSLFLRFGRGP